MGVKFTGDKQLRTPHARSKLDVRGTPYFIEITKDADLGYRKGKRGGVWVARRRIRSGTNPYHVEKIGIADDGGRIADGRHVMDYNQAKDRVREGAGIKLGKGRDKYRVQDAIDAYLKSLEGRASHYDCTRNLTTRVPDEIKNKLVKDLESDDLEEWHKALAEAPARLRSKEGGDQKTRKLDKHDDDAMRARKVSANRILGQLKAALNLSYRKEKSVTDDSAWRAVHPFKHVNKSRSAFLQEDECIRLFKAADEIDPDFGVLVRAACYTGARYSHLAGVRVKDFTIADAKIKDRKTGEWRMVKRGVIKITPKATPGKQGSGFHVKLTDEGRDFFVHLSEGKRPDDWLLGRQWKKSEQSQPMREAVYLAGLDPAITFNSLRHSYASISINNGINLTALAKNLGHSDTRMVQKHYGHLTEGYIDDQVDQHAPRFE